MGLYRMACAFLEKEKGGLYIDSLFTDFHRMAGECRLRNFAVFFNIGGTFKIVLNKGFNAETVRKSVSKSDFWDGTVETGNWHFIKNENLNAFFQFFSVHDSTFDCLCIKKAECERHSFIFLTAGEYSPEFLDKQVTFFLPVIKRTYDLLEYHSLTIQEVRSNKEEVLKKAKEAVQSGTEVSVFCIKLNILFESLFAFLCPSDFDCIMNAAVIAAEQSTQNAMLCAGSEEETAVYILLKTAEAPAFTAKLHTRLASLFTERSADFIRIEEISAGV